MTDETQITERKDGVTMSVEVKRGTGTRDQDTVYVKAHYDSVAEAQESWSDLHGLAAAQAEAARKIQPDVGGDSD
jgi:hypothetical protein